MAPPMVTAAESAIGLRRRRARGGVLLPLPPPPPPPPPLLPVTVLQGVATRAARRCRQLGGAMCTAASLLLSVRDEGPFRRKFELVLIEFGFVVHFQLIEHHSIVE